LWGDDGEKKGVVACLMWISGKRTLYNSQWCNRWREMRRKICFVYLWSANWVVVWRGLSSTVFTESQNTDAQIMAGKRRKCIYVFAICDLEFPECSSIFKYKIKNYSQSMLHKNYISHEKHSNQFIFNFNSCYNDLMFWPKPFLRRILSRYFVDKWLVVVCSYKLCKLWAWCLLYFMAEWCHDNYPIRRM
jgi:hypothetical protein